MYLQKAWISTVEICLHHTMHQHAKWNFHSLIVACFLGMLWQWRSVFKVVCLQATSYLNKLPSSFSPEDRILVADPMLATGT